jgi:D-beta-D-heptose 7-phosphate kinase/D-beta-D-heptose 1-phosphate adenosyltransferase
MNKILVIGESCKDIFHYGVCKRMCPEAPVPVFNSSNLIENGGMAMNTYNNIISLGGDADIITNDNWEQITKTRFVDKRTNHMFMRLDKNDSKYGRINSLNIDFKKYKAIVVSDYNKGFLSKEELEFISKLPVTTFLDTKKILGPWVTDFDFIKINFSEFENTKHTIEEKMKKKLIVTRGPLGCTFQDKNYSVPYVEVKDTSGAGDTFIASLSVKFCETNDINESIEYANKCATQVVQKMGVATI